MISQDEAFKRGLKLASALVEVPWSRSEQRLQAIKDNLNGLDDHERSAVAIATLYSLADTLRVASAVMNQYDSATQEFERRHAEQTEEIMQFAANKAFEELTTNIDLGHTP